MGGLGGSGGAGFPSSSRNAEFGPAVHADRYSRGLATMTRGAHHRRPPLRLRQDHHHPGTAGRPAGGAAYGSAPANPARTISTRPSTPPPRVPTASISTAWAMPPDAARPTSRPLAAADCDLFIIESSMGLFDGVAGAARTQRRRGRSRRPASPSPAAAGTRRVRPIAIRRRRRPRLRVCTIQAVRIAGVLLNQVASARHREGVTQAMAAHPACPSSAASRAMPRCCCRSAISA